MNSFNRAAYNLHSLATIMELSEKKSPLASSKRFYHELESNNMERKIDNSDNNITNIDLNEETIGRLLEKSNSLPYY